MAKRVVCYGDSNTWGYDPHTESRYPDDVRWTGILAQKLGGGYTVIEEGLNGRTTVWDDPIEEHRNGKTYLIPCLLTHAPLDLVIIMLGTNDLKKRFDLPAEDIARGAALLAEKALQTPAGIDKNPPKVLVVAPPPTVSIPPTRFLHMFEGAEEKSLQFSKFYPEMIAELDCEYMNAGDFIVSSKVDAIHFDPDEHRKLGEAMANKVREIIG